MIQSTKQPIKVDLHTHSIISHDGGITAMEYERLLTKGILDCIAITDHNEINFARIMQQKLGNKIIIGEEITTTEGEIIGLFLKETIPPGLNLNETIVSIKHQKGLVYVPHPFETMRKGIQQKNLELVHQEIDIIEVFNGRGLFRGKAKYAESFAKNYNLPKAASSDAHGIRGLGKTFSVIEQLPNRDTLQPLLQNGSMQKEHAPFYTLLYPTITIDETVPIIN